MKQLWRQIVGSYSQKSGKWVLAMLLSISLLPFLLKAFFMLMRQTSLPAWQVIMSQTAGWLGAWIFLYTAFRSWLQQPGESYWRQMPRVFARGGLWLLAMAMLSDTINSLYLSQGGMIAVNGRPGWFTFGWILVMLLTSFLLAGAGWWLAVSVADPSRSAGFWRMAEYWLRRPLLCLGSTISLGLMVFAIPLLDDIILALLPWHAVSFFGYFAGTLLLVLLEWLILQPLLAIYSFHAAASMQNQNTVPRPTGRATAFPVRLLSVIIAILLILSSGVYQVANGQPISDINAVKSDIEFFLSNARMMEATGDFAAAAYYSEIAEARIFAWQEAVLDVPGALQRANVLAPMDEQIQLLAALKSAGRLQALEQGLYAGNHSPPWYLALLEAYSDSGSLTDRQRQTRAELLRLCILQEYFVQAAALPQNLTGQATQFAKMLDEFVEELASCRHYALVARLGEEGGLNRQLVLDTLTLAENYPGQIKLQYLAMSYGSSFLEDRASHYERTAAAALRYDQLFSKNEAGSVTADEIVLEKLSVAKALFECKQLDACAAFLADLTVTHPTLSKMQANCLFSLKQYDQCLDVVSQLLDKNPDDAQSLYLSAMSTLHLNDTTASLQFAIRLADLVLNSKDALEIGRAHV